MHFTFGASARREVLGRLQELNHQRWEEEEAERKTRGQEDKMRGRKKTEGKRDGGKGRKKKGGGEESGSQLGLL